MKLLKIFNTKIKYLVYCCLISICVMCTCALYKIRYRIPFLNKIVVGIEAPKVKESLVFLNSYSNSDSVFWTFAVIGHPRSEEEETITQELERAIQLCKQNKVDIIFIGGDCIVGYNYNLEKYKRDLDVFSNYIRSCEIPILVVPGNHDYSTPEQKAYFEEKINRIGMTLQRDKISFMLCNTMSWHDKIFNGEDFQMNYSDRTKRGYYMLPVPGNSDKYKKIDKKQYKRFRRLISGKIQGLPRKFDASNLPSTVILIMHHRVWASEGNYWFRRWHSFLKYQNAIVFSGDHTEHSVYKKIDNVRYFRTSLSSKNPSFIIGRFIRSRGLHLREIYLTGGEKTFN